MGWRSSGVRRGRALHWTSRLLDCAPLLALLIFGTLSCSEAPNADRRNLLVISLDTFRADASGLYGNREGHTPNLDGLGDFATVFVNAYTPIATTLPAHSSMLTGLYPRTHGLRWNGQRLAGRWLTLGEILRAEGYRTAALVSYKNMVHEGGMGQGFEHLSPPLEKGGAPIRSGAEVNEMATRWLETRPAGPFFLWVHYYEPHIPYESSAYSESLLNSYTGPLERGVGLEELGQLIRGEGSDDDLRALRAHYDGGIRAADRLLGELLSQLDRLGERSNTVIIVVADHGELLGEHDQYSHGKKLWEEALRIPFLIADPQQPGGRQVEERVSLIDVMPTALELLGVTIPEQGQGRSVASAVRGGELSPKIYFAEARTGKARARAPTKPEGPEEQRVSVYSGRFKLTLTKEGKAELFDLATDPGELSALDPANVKVGDPAAGGDVDLAVLEKLARQHQAVAADGPPDSTRELDQEEIENLRQLGYIQ